MSKLYKDMFSMCVSRIQNALCAIKRNRTSKRLCIVPARYCCIVRSLVILQ